MALATPAASAANAQRGRHRPELRRLVGAVDGGRLDEALAECEALLAEDASHPAALYGLGIVAAAKGEHVAALQALTLAHEHDPEECVFSEVLAVMHATAGDLGNAVYYAKLSAALGLDQQALDLLPRALPSFATAFETIGDNPYRVQAEAWLARRQNALAIQAYERHLAFFPHDANAIRGYGRALLCHGRPAQAAAALSALYRDGRAHASDLSLLGEAFTRMGEFSAAEGCHREAMALAPADPGIACAWLRDAVFTPGRTGEDLVELCRHWGATVAGADARPPAGPVGQRMRVGFLLAECRDPRDAEVLSVIGRTAAAATWERVYYGQGAIDHPANALLRDGATWRDIAGLDPLTLAATIRGDEIDVLIDLGGHAAPTALLAMGQRAAPMQVSWLGNPATLGLSQVDFELVGDSEEPASADAAGQGHLWVMPHGRYAYAQPQQSSVPRPSHTGGVVFGAEITLAQLHPELVSCWAEILRSLPGATLVLRDLDFVEGGLADRLRTRFALAGIAERVEVIAAQAPDFWGQVDIALAPLVAINPHDAAGALAAGVPVIALAGAGRHRRQASTLLHHVGLGAEIVHTVEEYRDRAIALADSVERRSEAMAAVAAAVGSSAVFDPSRFAVAFGDVLGRMSRLT